MADSKTGEQMIGHVVPASRLLAASVLLFGFMPAVTSAGDLSGYRNFKLGADLSSVAKQAGTGRSATVIHRRPALIEEMQWRPPSIDSTAQAESAKDVVFCFINGKLFRITVNYDHYDTEGLTSEDMIEAISATYGTATKPSSSENAAQQPYGEQIEVLAHWQDSLHRFDLIRSSHGPSFRLVGVLRELETPAEAAINDAVRLDNEEAPQREAARQASEEQARGAKLSKARLANKPKFRP